MDNSVASAAPRGRFVDFGLWAGVIASVIACAWGIRWEDVGIRDLVPLPAVLKYAVCGSFFITLAYIIFLAVNAVFFRGGDKTAPRGCTVIVPAFNEGRHVMVTIESLLKLDWPTELLEIIAIDDGSKDDTWEWIERAAALAPERVTPIRLEKNGGKKHALYLGMKQAKHEIVVTVDSDTVVAPEALYYLLAPFNDAKIGAVAGSLRAKPEVRNFYTMVMDVALVFGCEFLRAGQSVNRTVFCTPGALSAYRREAVLPLLDEWLGQTFLGLPATIGEDRAIATLVLRSGWGIVYARRAVATTSLPLTYMRLCKMLLRWNRSDIRENLMMLPMLVRLHPWKSWHDLVTFCHWGMFCLNVILPAVFLPLLVYTLCMVPDAALFLGVSYLAAIVLGIIPATVYTCVRGPRLSVWAFIYSLFWGVGLIWVPVYSLLTVRNSKWLTR